MTQTTQCPQCGSELPRGMTQGLCPNCLIAAGVPSDFNLTGEPSVDATTPQPGSFVPPTVAEIAPLFPQLEVLELLGHGGMGAVYKARQTKLDRLVALKIIRPEAAGDPAFTERFNREARTLARLSHPNIVGVHDFGEVAAAGSTDDAAAKGRRYFFLMEFVDGANLRQLIHGGKLTPEQALSIVPQICDALQFAHDEGVVHRDIKPENILLDTRGRVKIADFGLAKLAERSADNFTLTATHQVMGTPRYMAPEQMEGSHKVDHRADIYSLGVVFYEMLTGSIPAGHFDPPSKKVRVDVRLDEVVLRSLAHEPERRYQQASELRTDVESISSIPAVPAPRSPESPAARKKEIPFDAMAFFILLLVNIMMHGLLLFTMHWTASSWPLLGLAALWFVLSAVAAHQEGKVGESESLVNGLITLCLTIGLVGYGVVLAGSAMPLLVILVCIAAAIGGGAFGITVAEADSGDENEKASEEASADADDEDEEEEDGEAESDTAAGIMRYGVGMIVFAAIAAWQLIGADSNVLKTVREEGAAAVDLRLWVTLVSPIVLLGGIGLLNLRWYPLAVIGAVLCMPLGIWHDSSTLIQVGPLVVGVLALGILLKPEVRDTFRRNAGLPVPDSTGEESPAQPRGRSATESESTIARAWRDWWRDQDRWMTNAVLVILSLGHIACMLAFLAPHGGFAMDQNSRSVTRRLGMPSPWFDYECKEQSRAFTDRYNIDWLSSSMMLAVAGLACWYAFCRLMQSHDRSRSIPWVMSPGVVSTFWIVLAVCLAGWGMVQARDLLQDAPSVAVGGPELPELHAAAAAGHISRLRQLLSDGGVDVNDKDGDGRTPLMLAAENGQTATVRALVLLGADVNARDNQRRTPLMLAAEHSHADVIDALYQLRFIIDEVRYAARSASRSGMPSTDLDLAGNAEAFREDPLPATPQPDVRQLLRDRLSGVDVQSFEHVQFRLPEFRIDVTAQDELGQTAMMKAAISGCADCIEHLEPWDTCTARDREGRTAAMLAVVHDQAQFLRDAIAAPSSGTGTAVGNFVHNALLSPEALSVPDQQGRTPLQYAIASGKSEIEAILRDELQRAIDHFDRAIAADDPYQFVAWRYRGYARKALGDDDQAANDFAEADRREAEMVRRQSDQDDRP